MGKFSMAKTAARDSAYRAPESNYEVVELPVERLGSAELMPWDSLCRLVDSIPGVSLKTVKGGDRVASGKVWFRRGEAKDGSLAGRTLLYQQG